MTTHKDFKRLVRSRMTKTGESYTAARAQLLTRSASRPVAPPPEQRSQPTALPPGRLAALAGMADEKIKAATGCTWEKWVYALDRVEAYTWPHRMIAQHIHDTYKTPMWWTQSVTVGYERIKGLREKGQRRDGGYELSKSKTFAAPVGRVFRAFSDKRTRNTWLPGVDLTIRTKIRDKSMRITWPDQTLVIVGFIPKGRGKSQVAIAHAKLADKSALERTRKFWGERLATLGEVLEA